jgi:hypothetical protein
MRELISAIRTFIAGWNNRATSSSGPKQATKSSGQQTVNQLQNTDQ